MSTQYRFEQDEFVRFKAGPISGIGQIEGIAAIPVPELGGMWIVRPVSFDNCAISIPNETYPFDTLTVFDRDLKSIEVPQERDEEDEEVEAESAQRRRILF